MTADALLAQRPFVLFWCARVATMMAQPMIAVAVGWQVRTVALVRALARRARWFPDLARVDRLEAAAAR